MEPEILSVNVERVFDLVEIHIIFRNYTELNFTVRSSSLSHGKIKLETENGHSIQIMNRLKTLDWTGKIYITMETQQKDVSLRMNDVKISQGEWNKLLQVNNSSLAGGSSKRYRYYTRQRKYKRYSRK